jgi:hypothetical protein
MGEFEFFENKTGTPVLDLLETEYVFLEYAIKESIAVVQPEQHEGADSIVAGVEIQEPSDSAEVPDLEVQRAG